MIALVVAYDQNRVIGANGSLPWHYPEDLKYFKKVTSGHTVFMGRITYESILKSLGKPLPNRHHVVVSKTLKDDRVEVIDDMKKYLENTHEDLFIIGGASIYAQTLPWVDRLYITHIDASFEGDTVFPAWDESQFKAVKETQSGPLRFAVYERISHD